MFNPSNTTGVISATGTVNPSGAPCFSTVLLLFYLLAIGVSVLYVRLRFMISSYPLWYFYV